jgi:Domain of unknown function (DUF4296)
MHKNISIILIFLLFVVACSKPQKPKKPDNLISKDKMALLIYDLYVINAAKGVNRKALEKEGFAPEKYILDKYDVDSIQFSESNTYYAFDSETYNEIVEKVKARLEKEKEDYDELLKLETDRAKKKRDSLKAAQKKVNDSIKKAARASLKTN